MAVIPIQPVPQSLGRWRGAVGLNWKGLALVGDAFSNVVGLSDFRVFTEYGNTMRMLVTTPPVNDDRKRIFVSRFEIEVSSGQGLPPVFVAPPPSTTYCANPIVIAPPVELGTAGALSVLPTNFPSFWLSLWTFIPHDLTRGFIVTNQDDATLGTTNPGLFIKIANDITSTPQITVKAWDAANATIVTATYDFATWAAWTNVIISFDTVSQQIAVWTSTLVSSVLVEQALTPVALSWSSTNAVGNPTGHPWRVLTVGS